ncbi:MAG: hypothetical protein AAFY31_15290 [Pseudomonadota bacterium]
MTSNVKDRATAGQRAGLPLARAQRLTAETQKRARKGSAGLLYGVGILGVAGLVAFGVSSEQNSTSTQTAAIQTPLPEQPAIGAADATPPSVTSAQTAGVVQAAVPSSEAALAASPTVTSLPIDVSHPACVQSVETRLNTLHEMTANQTHWSQQQNALSDLVQAALDCNDTRLKIVGSIELIGTNMADVRVRWDRNNWTLDLNMIDNIEQQAALSATGITDDAVEFVIR